MVEEWKPLVYGDVDLSYRLEVSNFGNVRNINTKKEIRTTIHPNGYRVFVTSLGKRKKFKLIRVHRAVAFAFVGDYRDGFEVNHIDGNKLNNYADNLEWVSRRTNNLHAIDHGLRVQSTRVKCNETGDVFGSIGQAARWCGLDERGTSIHEYFRKKNRKTAGRHPITGEKLTWSRV